MGQYHLIVNLDKREYIHPHKLASGLKAWEQLANTPGTGAGLIALICCPETRGGGDIEHDDAGRWHGDRVVMIGDYAEDRDIPGSPAPASHIYALCDDDYCDWHKKHDYQPDDLFKDVSDIAAGILEDQLGGKFTGDGWRDWTLNARESATA